MSLLDPLFRSSAVDSLFTDRATLQGILDFEAALARAEARAGVIPGAAAAVIAKKCRAELFDTAALAQAAAHAGNILIPLVKNLTALVAKKDKRAAHFVHWGATSQAAIRVPGLVSSLLTAIVQEDERGLGGWHAEWETLPDIVQLTAGAIGHLATIVPKLEVDVQRMRKNLDLTQGLIFTEAVSMALGKKIGRARAHEIVQTACATARKEKRDLRTILSGDRKVGAQLSTRDLDRLFDPRNYLGAAEEYVYRVVAASRGRIPRGEK